MGKLRGLAVPLTASSTGGFRTVEGPEYVRQLVRTALGSGDNLHPFQQDLGLGEDMIFSLSGAELVLLLRTALRRVFVQLQNSGVASFRSFDVLKPEKEGEIHAQIWYNDLVHGQADSVTVSFSRR